MEGQLFILVIQICLLVGPYIVGKYVLNNPSETIQDVAAKVNLIIQYADKFVAWAKYFMSEYTGKEKMDEVVKQLKSIADKHNIDISEDEIKAIAQKAYDNMKAQDKINNT